MVNISVFNKNKPVGLNFAVSFVLNIFLWIILYWQVPPQVDPIVLKYNIYFGISLIGPWWQVFLWPLTGLIFWLINLILVLIWSKKSRLLTLFVSYTTILIQLLLIVIGFFVVMLNK